MTVFGILLGCLVICLWLAVMDAFVESNDA